MLHPVNQYKNSHNVDIYDVCTLIVVFVYILILFIEFIDRC